MANRNEFDAGRAMRLRIMDAVERDGGPAMLVARAAGQVGIQTFGKSVEEMRTLGGYSEVARQVIAKMSVEAETKAWLRESIGDIVAKAKMALRETGGLR